MFFSCFGWWNEERASERRPLLSQHEDDTTLQRELHQKLHSYQMIRALFKGFIPSNEQAIANLRTLLATEILNPDPERLSDSGRALALHTKQWLTQFLALLQHKNNGDQIQKLIWNLRNARISLDAGRIARRTAGAKQKADVEAAWRSLRALGSLLLSNSDFRLLLSDLGAVGREVLRDTAFALSDVARDTGMQLEPSADEQELLKKPGRDAEIQQASQEVNHQDLEIAAVLTEGAVKVAGAAGQSVTQKVQGDEKHTLLYRLRRAVHKLRQRPDYNQAASTFSLFLKHYALAYSRVVSNVVETAEEGIDTNPAMEKAARSLHDALKSFGKREEWEGLEKQLGHVLERGRGDPQFAALIREVGNSSYEMFTDPSFFEHADERFRHLREKARELTSESSLREEIDVLLSKAQTVFHSVWHDEDVAGLVQITSRIAHVLSPAHQTINSDLVSDAINVFLPLLVRSTQYIPIPRVEISTPEIDLLLENLILEPGKAINESSFLPFKLRVQTYNDIEVRKARFRAVSAIKTIVSVRIDGLSIQASEVGFWLKVHSGLLQLFDKGIASFQLDERGIDIQLELELGKDRLEHVVTLRGVCVKIHKLNWTLKQSKFSLMAWLLGPFLRPLVRRTLEQQIASSLTEIIRFANREFVYARERLRAARIANPVDLHTFLQAVLARLVPEDDPESSARVGLSAPNHGVFARVYAPGSIVKLWNEEAAQALQRIRENEAGGWKNAIFDVHRA